MISLTMATDETWQILADVEHSLKTPLLAAYRRAQAALDRDAPDKRDLLVIRALCAKAYSQLSSVRVLTRMARGEELKATLEPIRFRDLARIVLNAVTDAENLVRPREVKIRFHPEGDERASLSVDTTLFEMALRNVLDNATKYSFDHQTVDVELKVVGSALGRTIQVSVSNVGVVLSASDLKHVVQRGWRSEVAQWTSGEGSGIGLWIVDNVMRALGGEVTITPTDQQKRTVVSLRLPVQDNAHNHR